MFITSIELVAHRTFNVTIKELATLFCDASKQILPNFPFPGDCGHPIAPQNGFLESYISTMESSEVFYSCDPGLVPEGRMRAVCTEDGWSPNPADLNCTVGMCSDWIMPVYHTGMQFHVEYKYSHPDKLVSCLSHGSK